MIEGEEAWRVVGIRIRLSGVLYRIPELPLLNGLENGRILDFFFNIYFLKIIVLFLFSFFEGFKEIALALI